MKKIYVSVILFLAAITSNNAQVLLLQSNHAPVIGDSYATSICSTVGVSAGPSGSGSFWDMSAISITTNSTTYSVVAVPSSSASAYPSASVAIQTGASSTYNFYSSSSSSLKYWGGDIQISTYNVNLDYTSAAVFAAYPVSFNTTNTNTIAGNLSASSISGSFTGTCSINADGTGTLALPSRTFTNIMRLSTTQDISFTTSFGSGTLTQVNYDYYSTLSKTPLFTISTATIVVPLAGTSNQTVVTVNSNYQYVGINETINEITSLNLFPNPAKNNFSLSFNNETAEMISYELMNSVGQVVKKENLGNQSGKVNYSVNVSDLPSGIYFIRVNAGSKVSIKKITIQ